MGLAITAANGALTSQQRYLPFGGVRTNIASSPISQTDYGYTGQRDDSYIKLMDYDFRWYSPELSRFVSPDSIVPNLANPQSLNRFTYVLNNPIRYNDPTGHSIDCGLGDPYCTAGTYTPGGLINLYRDQYGGEDIYRIGISGDRDGHEDMALHKKLSGEIEDYMKSHPDYDPKEDPHLAFAWFSESSSTNMDVFKARRHDFWRDYCFESGKCSWDEVGNLMSYYDFNKTDIYETKWSASNVDWYATTLDGASMILSFFALNEVAQYFKISTSAGEFINVSARTSTVSSGMYSISNSDTTGLALTGAGAIPGPPGLIFSGISVIRDLSGGSYQVFWNPPSRP